MNAAARLLNQGALSRGWVVSVFMNRAQFFMLMLMAAVLMSALSIVYVTNTIRGLNTGIQQAEIERDQLHIQTGQLLLEKSTSMMQARVQTIAETELDMAAPDNNSVVVVNE